jgi:hypothetical protein
VQTVYFASSQITHREMYTQVRIPIVVQNRDGNPITLEVLAEAGTATADVDFVPGWVTAHLSAEDTLQAFVRIYQDTVPEGPETIRLSIMEGFGLYVIGHPSEATLTIVDDDTVAPYAYFELAGDFPQDPWGNIALVGEPDVSTEVDVVVQDLPPGGTTIHYTSTVDEMIHALVFTDDPRQTIVVPAEAIPPGQAHVLTELKILNTPTMKATSGPWLRRGSLNLSGLSVELKECVTCLIPSLAEMINIISWDQLAADCPSIYGDQASWGGGRQPAGTMEYADDLTTLRRYRDEVLMGSPGGAYYLQLYTDYSPDIGSAILKRPTLIHRVLDTWNLWLPAVAAQVDGQGSTFMVTGAMQDALLGVMAEMEELGSPELATLIDDFRVSLDLASIAGTTAADLQQAIEDNPMETETATWGNVKAMFR